MIKQQFREESKVILQALQGIHHARKLDFMQVSYGDTVTKLSVMQGRKPVTLDASASSYSMKDALSHSTASSSSATSAHNDSANVHTHSFNNNQTNKIMKMKEFQQTINNTIESEHHLNMKKRLYNREIGRKAVVNQIMAGTAPMPKHVLFAQKMNHNQILAMTGTLCAPDPRKEPPAVAQRKKYNEESGWE